MSIGTWAVSSLYGLGPVVGAEPLGLLDQVVYGSVERHEDDRPFQPVWPGRCSEALKKRGDVHAMACLSRSSVVEAESIRPSG
jgi:hypothetical protein